MSNFSKIIVTLVAFIVFFIVSITIVEIRHDAGHKTPGVFGTIAMLGIIGAIRGIWCKDDKSDKNDKDDDGNGSILQK